MIDERDDWKPLFFALIIAGVGVRVVEMLLAGGTLIDDAYITLRYARNLALGRGMVYNTGERVLGAPPLYVLITAGLWRIVSFCKGSESAIGYVVTLFNIVLTAGAAWLLGRQLRRSLGFLACLPLLIFALYLPFIDNATTGMETTLFVAVLLLSLHLLRARRPAWASLCLGLAVLIRAEALLWIAAVMATEWRRGKRPWSAAMLLPLAGVGAAWAIFGFVYFGTPIPHNVVAKSGWNVGLWGREGLFAYAWQVLHDFTIVPQWGSSPLSRVVMAGEVLLMFGFGAWGLRTLWRERSADLAWGLFFAGYVIFFVAGRGALGPSWYVIPPGLAIVIVAVHGLRAFVRAGPPAQRPPPAAGSSWPILRTVLCGLLALLVLGGSFHAWNRLRRPYYGAMETGYGRTGRFLAGVEPTSRLLVNEIGYIGYLADRHVYDMAGIVTPEVLRLRKHAAGEIDVPELIRRFAPDYVVVTGPFKRDAVLESVTGKAIEPYRLVLEARPCYTFLRAPDEPDPFNSFASISARSTYCWTRL
ncbi:MAG: hypothetical protein V1774_06410 [Candidatus Eisenbacteria bacterium]